MKTVIGIFLWISMVAFIVFGTVVEFQDSNSIKTIDIGPYVSGQAYSLNYLVLPEANITLKSDDFFHLVDQKTKIMYFSEVVPPQPGENTFYFILKNPPSSYYQVFGGNKKISLYSETPAQIKVENSLPQKIYRMVVTPIVAIILFAVGTLVIVKIFL
jgi:hypothetical protein